MRQLRDIARYAAPACLFALLGAASPPALFPRGYDAAYQAYLAALGPKLRTVGWLGRLEGAVAPALPIRVGGAEALYLTSCNPNNCWDEQVVLFLMPDRKQVRIVLRLDRKEQLLAGAGPKESACVNALSQSGWSAKSC